MEALVLTNIVSGSIHLFLPCNTREEKDHLDVAE